ncbi:MAG: DUF2019 domain-containing protein [Albidovulum sp.]
MSDDLVERFISASTRRLAAIERNDTRSANREFIKVSKMRAEFWVLPDHGASLLRQLLEVPNEQARATAAIYLLPLDEARALNTLRDLLENARNPEIRMSASNSLDLWPKGQMDFLKIPPA